MKLTARIVLAVVFGVAWLALCGVCAAILSFAFGVGR